MGIQLGRSPKEQSLQLKENTEIAERNPGVKQHKRILGLQLKHNLTDASLLPGSESQLPAPSRLRTQLFFRDKGLIT